MRRVRPPGVHAVGFRWAVLASGTALGRRSDLRRTMLRACTRLVRGSSPCKDAHQLGRHLHCNSAARPRSEDVPSGAQADASIAVGHSGPRGSEWAKDSRVNPADYRTMARLYLAFAPSPPMQRRHALRSATRSRSVPRRDAVTRAAGRAFGMHHRAPREGRSTCGDRSDYGPHDDGVKESPKVHLRSFPSQPQPQALLKKNNPVSGFRLPSAPQLE